MQPKLTIINNVFIRQRLMTAAQGAIWFIHAFGESGLSYKNLLTSKLGDHFNLYVPDFPGFGGSPLQPDRTSLEDAAQILIELINIASPTDDLFLVAHSVAGIIGTRVARALGPRVKGYFNIEGNLTAQDAYFSGQATKYTSGQQFKQDFSQQIYKMAQDNVALKRFFASVSFAHPDALMGWGQSSVQHSPLSGEEFAALACPKLYYWGKNTTSEAAQHFIASTSLPNKQFTNSGHWPMINQPNQCADDILTFFMSNTNT